jgi:hypothetical protein
LKQLDLFEKTIKSPIIPDKYKYRSRPHHGHGNLYGLRDDDQRQHYNWPESTPDFKGEKVIYKCKCGTISNVYIKYEERVPEYISNRYRLLSSDTMEEVHYEVFHCAYCGKKGIIRNGSIHSIEIDIKKKR